MGALHRARAERGTAATGDLRPLRRYRDGADAPPEDGQGAAGEMDATSRRLLARARAEAPDALQALDGLHGRARRNANRRIQYREAKAMRAGRALVHRLGV